MATATTATFDKEILGVSEDVHECGVGKDADPSLLDLGRHTHHVIVTLQHSMRSSRKLALHWKSCTIVGSRMCF